MPASFLLSPVPDRVVVGDAATTDTAGEVPLSPTSADAAPAGKLSPAIKTDCIRRDESGQFLGWMDFQHCVFSGRTVASARWFDDLFGNWSDDEAEMLVRIISEVGWDEENGWSSVARIRANAALPNASKRLRLIISDEGEEPLRQDQRSAPQRLGDIQDNATVALRWIPKVYEQILSDLDVGVHSGPDIYARLRMRRVWGISQEAVFKLGQTFRYGTESLGVSTSQVGLERVMSEHAVLRFSTVYQINEADHADGFVWTHGLSMSHVLEKNGSLGYGFSVSGHTRPDTRRESYGPWLLWRKSLGRDWLYYEIEPRLTRYRDLDWDMVPSLLLRLEVQLGNHKKR